MQNRLMLYPMIEAGSLSHPSLNLLTWDFRLSASTLSRSLISEAFSAESEVFCTSCEMVLMCSETAAMHAACSSEEAEISEIFCSTSSVMPETALNDSDTAFASPMLELIELDVCSISAVIFEAESPHFLASVPTSLATTAKPFPAAPADAASIDAFIARICVWKAMLQRR